MGDDYELNIKFVKLVEQYPVLYDHTIDAGPNRMGHQNAWQEIASQFGEDWITCKEKWKNMRSCYTRNLRNQIGEKSQYRRTYYLSPYMEFILPFCKNNGANTPVTPEICTKTEVIDTEFEQDSSIIIESVHSEYNESKAESEGENKEIGIPYKIARRPCKFKRRSLCTGEKQSVNNRVIRKPIEDDADLNFLKSLLPEIRSMNSRQKNRFRISVLSIIQNILYAGDNSIK